MVATEGRDEQKSATAGQYLTFILKGQAYGVRVAAVREINRAADITPVPQTPSFVAGVMNLRGKVIPVVDLRLKFGLGAMELTKESCIIVIEGDSGQVGTIVDSVSSVVDFAEAHIEPPPHMGHTGDAAFITGMGKADDKVVILVDIVAALSRERLMAITETAAQAA